MRKWFFISIIVVDLTLIDVHQSIVKNKTVKCTNTNFRSSSSMSQTEIIPMVESCENRCGKKEEKLSDAYHLTCDCDDDCFYLNRCCPDFFDFCLAGEF